MYGFLIILVWIALSLLILVLGCMTESRFILGIGVTMMLMVAMVQDVSY